MAVDYVLTDNMRVQPPFELDQVDNAYWLPPDGPTLRTYTHPNGTELFSVTSIQSAVHGKSTAIKMWEQSDPEWANYWRHYTAVRGTNIHEELLGQYADRPMERYEKPSERPLEENLSEEDVNKAKADIERAKQMWSKIWTTMGHEFGDVRGVEVRVWNEEYGYAGTFDLLMQFDNMLSLIDLKTGKDYYPKYGEQLSAYQLAAEEMYDFDIEQRCVIRLCPDKQENPFLDPEVHYAADKREQWKETCNEFHNEIKPTLVPIEDEAHLEELVEEAES